MKGPGRPAPKANEEGAQEKEDGEIDGVLERRVEGVDEKAKVGVAVDCAPKVNGDGEDAF